jgi:hypothetical protein
MPWTAKPELFAVRFPLRALGFFSPPQRHECLMRLALHVEHRPQSEDTTAPVSPQHKHLHKHQHCMFPRCLTQPAI